MAESFKKKYKLQGLVTSVILMWLDFIVIYLGLINGNSALMAGGMAVMLGATAIAYYFG
ncbi:hypothetical protein [Zhaonella formicivorans]|jgi:hypothetical protein|uniref:hypothetical protein n=1 Tax=Zhaonella formicivorans TaxID=2528593 RepID=UPI001D12BE0F|nr:hypothetical protein [Zhaonella formicivorans]